MLWDYLMIYQHLKISIFILCSLSYVINAKEIPKFNFDKCIDFYLNTSKEFIDLNNKNNTIRAIHIGDGKYLAYSNEVIKNPKIIKYDVALGLYLFLDSKLDKKYTLSNITQYTIKNKQLIAINNKISKIGNIIFPQQSFLLPAIFSENIYENSVINDICYQFYGLSIGNNKFINKQYIDYFLSRSNGSGYSQIGLITNDNKNGVVIDNVNPLINLMLKKSSLITLNKGDLILRLNNNPILSSNKFEDSIALTKPNTTIKLEIKRGNSIFNVPLITKEKISNFMDKTSYLELIGISIDDNLLVTNDNPSFDFKKNDKVLKVNQIMVDSINEFNDVIDSVVNDNDKVLSILVLRDGFELFISIDLSKEIDAIF